MWNMTQLRGRLCTRARRVAAAGLVVAALVIAGGADVAMADDPVGQIPGTSVSDGPVPTLITDQGSGIAGPDGPGYGGAVAELEVATEDVTADSLIPDKPMLRVSGFGFRANSPVTIRIGAGNEYQSVASDVGQVTIHLPAEVRSKLATGTTVVAQGRTPGGVNRVIYGAVPPQANGVGPMDAVVWLALFLGGSWFFIVLRRRLSEEADEGDAGEVMDGE